MALTQFARTEEANIGILNARLRQQLKEEIFWSRFAGYTEVKMDSMGRKEYMPSGQPIEILNDFVNEGMDFMLVPMLLELTGAGIYGDKQLEGNEEAQDLYYNKVYINQVRNGIRSGGKMSNQRVKTLNLLKAREPQLRRWLARVRDIQIAKTFYEGWSPHITATAANGGLYINSGAQRHHPNFFTAGSSTVSQVTWNATDATYNSSIDAALDGLTDTSGDYLSIGVVEAMRVEVQKLNIKPMVTKDGYEFYPWVIHPNQGKQLRSDSDWKAAYQNAAKLMSKENPLFTGAMGEYAGFVFYERLLGVMGATASADTVTYGATNPLSAVDTNPKKCSIIFGSGAIQTGVAAKPFVKRGYYDYENIDGVSIGTICGDARGEYVDSTSSKTAIINQSSCIVATYSS